MKVLHVTFSFFPESIGGSEVYVAALAGAQRQAGHEVTVTAPADEDRTYHTGGTKVIRFTPDSFSRVLHDEKPDIVHLHARSPLIPMRSVESVRRKGARVVFTYHGPGTSCQRGTLLHRGRKQCDGRVEVRRCAGCVLEHEGVSPWKARFLALTPMALGGAAASLGFREGRWTALRVPERIRDEKRSLRGLIRTTDAFIALCDWARDLFRNNGIPESKIHDSRHGLPGAQAVARKGRDRPGPLRVLFLGRLDPAKGPHLLIDALSRIPEAGILLDLHGAGGEGDPYVDHLRMRVSGDSRVRLLPALRHEKVLRTMAGYDLLAVPSMLVETGPLVVLEAYQSGVPVMGSDLGGLRELVTNGVNGMLVRPGNVGEWARALSRIARNPTLLSGMREKIPPVRGVDEVAVDMTRIYERIRGS